MTVKFFRFIINTVIQSFPSINKTANILITGNVWYTSELLKTDTVYM